MKISWKESGIVYALGLVNGMAAATAEREATDWYDMAQINDYFFEYSIRWNGEKWCNEVKWVNTRHLKDFPDEQLLISLSPGYNEDDARMILEVIKRQKRKLT